MDKTEVILKFAQLPPYVMIGGKDYSPIIMRSGRQVRFCYQSIVDDDYTLLYENIENDEQMIDVLNSVSHRANKLINRAEAKQKRKDLRNKKSPE